MVHRLGHGLLHHLLLLGNYLSTPLVHLSHLIVVSHGSHLLDRLLHSHGEHLAHLLRVSEALILLDRLGRHSGLLLLLLLLVRSPYTLQVYLTS